MNFLEGYSSSGYTLMLLQKNADMILKTWPHKPHRIVVLWAKLLLWLRWAGR